MVHPSNRNRRWRECRVHEPSRRERRARCRSSRRRQQGPEQGQRCGRRRRCHWNPWWFEGSCFRSSSIWGGTLRAGGVGVPTGRGVKSRPPCSPPAECPTLLLPFFFFLSRPRAGLRRGVVGVGRRRGGGFRVPAGSFWLLAAGAAGMMASHSHTGDSHHAHRGSCATRRFEGDRVGRGLVRVWGYCGVLLRERESDGRHGVYWVAWSLCRLTRKVGVGNFFSMLRRLITDTCPSCGVQSVSHR